MRAKADGLEYATRLAVGSSAIVEVSVSCLTIGTLNVQQFMLIVFASLHTIIDRK